MADTETTRIESVLAGIRDYLTGQLDALDLELRQAEQAVVEMSRELTSKQDSVMVLRAGRDILVSKLAELDGAKDSGTIVRGRRSPKAAAAAVAPQIVAQAQGDAVVGALPDSDQSDPAQPSASESKKGGATAQNQVLEYLNATPGIHKVAEIAAAVCGSDASPLAVQGIRRALAALLRTGQADKSTQSGTAFYAAVSPSVSEAAVKGKATRKKASPRVAKETAPDSGAVAVISDETSSSTGARIPAARKAKAGTKTSAAKKSTPKKTTSVPTTKSVRADRPTIVATLRAAAQPQSAADLSRAVMGEHWKPSDATNFRNVLKSLAKEGAVVVVPGDKNRSAYAAVPSA